METSYSPAQILAARSYVNACENVGVAIDARQARIARCIPEFGAEAGGPDTIESTVEPETVTDELTPATAWMVLNNDFSVCLTRSTAPENEGKIFLSFETLSDEPQEIIVEDATNNRTLFEGSL